MSADREPGVEETAQWRTQWPAVQVALIGTFLASLDSFIAIVAAPSIGTDLNASDDEIQWIHAVYPFS